MQYITIHASLTIRIAFNQNVSMEFRWIIWRKADVSFRLGMDRGSAWVGFRFIHYFVHMYSFDVIQLLGILIVLFEVLFLLTQTFSDCIIITLSYFWFSGQKFAIIQIKLALIEIIRSYALTVKTPKNVTATALDALLTPISEIYLDFHRLWCAKKLNVVLK